MNKDVKRLLQEMLSDISRAQSSLEDTMPLPDDLDIFLQEWNIPEEYHQIFARLAGEAEYAYAAVESFESLINKSLRDLA